MRMRVAKASNTIISLIVIISILLIPITYEQIHNKLQESRISHSKLDNTSKHVLTSGNTWIKQNPALSPPGRGYFDMALIK